VLPGARYFERLLTRFTVPEELFGPLSLRALEDDRYERLTEGYLPQTEVAFLDEVFKANSAILNTLLGLLHERRFDNGAQRLHTPLVCLVGASNERPEDDSLLAFYDRFLLRVPVAPVDDDHFAALLQNPAAEQAPVGTLDPEWLAHLRQQADALPCGPEVIGLLRQARQRCRDSGQTVSDRRWRQVARLLQVQAASRGRAQADAWDAWLLPFLLGETPEQVQDWTDWFMAEVAQARPLDLDDPDKAVRAFEGQLEIEERAPAQDEQDSDAGKQALAQAMTSHSGASPSVRMVSQRARRHYGHGHIQTRLAQVDELAQSLDQWHAQVQAQAQEIGAQARHHAWLPPSWQARIEAVHRQRCAALDGLRARLQTVAAGFAALPHDDGDPA
jgi:MoxR-like ATPase